jgi:diguanylate cyclase
VVSNGLRQETVEKISKASLKWFVENNTTLTPVGFFVMFQYFSGKDQSIIDYINKEYPKNKNNELFWEYCYSRFIDKRKESFVEKIVNKLDVLTQQKTTSSENSLGDFEAYQQQLVNFKDTDISQIYLQDFLKNIKNSAKVMLDDEKKFLLYINQIKKELEETKKELEKTKREAEYDHLTGIFNRRKFENEAKKMINIDLKREKDFFLCIADLDNFKKINDKHGHIIGDAVLVKFSQVLKKQLKENIIGARIGGEEFVLFFETTEDEMKDVCEKIRIEISSFSFKNTKTGEMIGKITASFGVSKLNKDELCWIDAYDRADESLYKAKNSGKDKVVIFGQ